MDSQEIFLLSSDDDAPPAAPAAPELGNPQPPVSMDVTDDEQDTSGQAVGSNEGDAPNAAVQEQEQAPAAESNEAGVANVAAAEQQEEPAPAIAQHGIVNSAVSDLEPVPYNLFPPFLKHHPGVHNGVLSRICENLLHKR